MYYIRRDKTRTVSLSPSLWQSPTPARPPPRPITPRPQPRLKIQAAYKGPAMPSLSLGCPTYLGCGIGSKVAGCSGPSGNDECTLASTIFNSPPSFCVYSDTIATLYLSWWNYFKFITSQHCGLRDELARAFSKNLDHDSG